jgi:hypothetical protein
MSRQPVPLGRRFAAGSRDNSANPGDISRGLTLALLWQRLKIVVRAPRALTTQRLPLARLRSLWQAGGPVWRGSCLLWPNATPESHDWANSLCSAEWPKTGTRRGRSYGSGLKSWRPRYRRGRQKDSFPDHGHRRHCLA